jgi:hypothetical protein
MAICANRRVPAALAGATFLLLLSGCSRQAPVSGSVTFNGTPVDNGIIVFISEDNTDKKAIGEIHDGKFTIPSTSGVLLGKNRVEIYWNKKTGKQVEVKGDAGHTTDEEFQVIPARFNANSTLSEEIKSGENTFAFDLKGVANTPKSSSPSSSDKRRRD